MSGLMYALLIVGLVISEILAAVFYFATGDAGAIPMFVLPVVFLVLVIAIKVYELPQRVRNAILEGKTEFREGNQGRIVIFLLSEVPPTLTTTHYLLHVLLPIPAVGLFVVFFLTTPIQLRSGLEPLYATKKSEYQCCDCERTWPAFAVKEEFFFYTASDQ
jgi:hypothetical protein